MILRPYQQAAFDDIWLALQCELNVLLEAACSAGKTLIFSKIIQKLLNENPSFRALILTDREILVSQTAEKLEIVAPELMLDIGIVCAGVSTKKELEKRVTIASRQSLINKLNSFPPVHLIVVDECHLLAMPQIGQIEPLDQFGAIIATLRSYNPNMRLLGVTATPYRLGDGYIYGKKNKPGSDPYFGAVHYRITTRELLALGWISPLIGKTALDDTITSDISTVKILAGEYKTDALSRIMSKLVHIDSAVDTWKEFASDRKKTLAFCVDINHAEILKDAFNAAEIPAIAIHSQNSDEDDLFGSLELKKSDSKIKVFCSVAKLTTGMDVPDIDCILMARPTKSAALYKQILGRGQRICPGKVDCLVLDIVGNNNEFGTDLDKLKIKYSDGGASDIQTNVREKECPECSELLHIAIRVCPACGYLFAEKIENAKKPDMIDVFYGTQPPETYTVKDILCTLAPSKKSKKLMLRLQFILARQYFSKTMTANIYLMFPNDGYSGKAVSKTKMYWEKLTRNADYPISADDAYDRLHSELIPPLEVNVIINENNSPEIIDLWGVNEDIEDVFGAPAVPPVPF